MMIIVTTETVPGKNIDQVLGMVSGNVVQSKHVGRDIMAGLKTIVGGEIAGYTEMLTEAREVATTRMISDARSLGANAIVNIRFTTSAVGQGMSELLAYGTAVSISD